MKPIIGLTTYGRAEMKVPSEHYDEHFVLPALYVDAVRRAGGVPVLLPPGESDLEAILAAVDGVIVTGGGDVLPSAYDGDSQHPALEGMDPERDRSELTLLRLLSDESDTPTLCICRGMQAANVALGGSLYEHIPDVQSEDIHRSEDGGWAIQPLQVEADSQLARIMAEREVSTYSGHHQAVDRVADPLRVVGQASDGIIEALEHSEHPWFVAVQWHPECSAASDPSQQRIFDELVAAARIRAERRRTLAPGRQRDD